MNKQKCLFGNIYKKNILAFLFLLLIFFHFSLMYIPPSWNFLGDAVRGVTTQNPKQFYWGICFQLEKNPDKSLYGKCCSVARAFAVHVKTISYQIRPWTPINTDWLTRRWIEVYGGTLRILQVSSFIKYSDSQIRGYVSPNGYTFWIQSPTKAIDLEQIANNVKQFSNSLSACNIPLIVVVNPRKIHKKYSILPRGVKSFVNEDTDQLLNLLRKHAIDCIDNRELFLDNPQKHYQMFYRTDHHWKIEYAFYAFVNIAQHLNTNYQFQIPQNLMKQDSYDVITRVYPLEQQETLRRVGRFFVEPEKTRNIYVLKGEKINTFPDDFYCFPTELYSDLEYKSDEGVYGVRHIHNPHAQNHKKILIIKDSFVEFLYQFFAFGCSHVDLIDCRAYKGKITDYIKKTNPDIVLIMYSTGYSVEPYMYRFDEPMPENVDYRR